MNRYVMVVLLFSVFMPINISYSADIRNSSWGDSLGDVKKSEPSEPIRQDINMLIYKTSLGSSDYFISYFFKKNKLFAARYVFCEAVKDESNYIEEFGEINDALESKYGESENMDKLNNEIGIKSIIERIRAGFNEFKRLWETENTKIILVMSCSDRKNILLEIGYVCKNINIDRAESQDGILIDKDKL